MTELITKVNEVILKLDDVTEHLYQQDQATAYNLLNGALLDLTQTIDMLYAAKLKMDTLEFNEQEMMAKLSEALTAMEANDMILIADILKYEIVEQLKNVQLQFL